MAKTRESFIYHIEWEDAIEVLPVEIRHEVRDAIMTYARSGQVPELSVQASVAFAFIRRDMDRDAQKYEETVTARSENGKRGARTRWGKQSANEGMANDSKNGNTISEMAKMANDSKNSKAISEMAKIANMADNDDDGEYDYDYDTQSVCVDVAQACASSSTSSSPHTDFSFFFPEMWKRNIPNPAYETQRFLDHYEVVEWTLEGGAKLDTDAKRLAKLRQWVPESTGKRFPEGFVTAWLKLAQRAPNAELKADMFDDRVEAIMSGTGVNTPILKCSSALRQWIMAPDNKAAQDAILAGWLKGKSGLKVNPYD